jgi:Family of unknown function (DUF5990)
MASSELTIDVICRHLPGICFKDPHNPDCEAVEPVYLGIQKGNEVIEAVPADRKQVIFRPTFRITQQPDGSPNFLGPFAKGTPQERFFYLSWGVMDKKGNFAMFRRAKIHLNHLTWTQVSEALKGNRPLKVSIGMTGIKGDPICASIRKDRANWEL